MLNRPHNIVDAHRDPCIHQATNTLSEACSRLSHVQNGWICCGLQLIFICGYIVEICSLIYSLEDNIDFLRSNDRCAE